LGGRTDTLVPNLLVAHWYSVQQSWEGKEAGDAGILLGLKGGVALQILFTALKNSLGGGSTAT